MPFLSIYSLALEQDMEYGISTVQASATLQNHTFLQVRGTHMHPRPGAKRQRKPLVLLFGLHRTHGAFVFLT